MENAQTHHTHTSSQKFKQKLSDIATFGKGLSVILFIFFLLSLYKGHTRLWLIGLSLGIMLIAFVAPRILQPVYRIAMTFGTFMHHIISPLLIAITFYVVFMPVGLLFRVIRKDLLNLKLTQENSYWVLRNPPGPAPDSLKNQF